MKWYFVVLTVLGGLVGLFLLYVLLVIVSSLFVDKNRIYAKRNAYYWWIMQSALFFVMRVARVRVHLTGTERIPKEGRFYLVSNHRSVFDPMIAIRYLRRFRLVFISKEENLKIPVAGPIMRRCNCLPIDRNSLKQSLYIFQKGKQLIESDVVSLGVYPEGTRSRTGELLPFHEGSLYPAFRAPCPVVVSVIRGTEQIGHRMPFKRTDVYLDILDVLPASYLEGKPMGQVSDEIRSEMEDFLKSKKEQ